MKEKKPPLGLMPKKLWDEQRLYEVCAAITRYYQAGKVIPIKWVKEYNEFMRMKGERNDSSGTI